MVCTVKKLAELSGVSVRTLQFYDKIGLLPPAYHGQNGYRYYEDEQLLRLQQILFFRELGFELKQIKKLLTFGDFDQMSALLTHQKELTREVERLNRLLGTLESTIKHLKGESKMAMEQAFSGFDAKKQVQYEAYLVKHHGSSAAERIEESRNRTCNWTKDKWASMKAAQERIARELAILADQDASVNSLEVQALIGQHFALIGEFYEPTPEVYEGLGQMYIDHPDFRKLYDGYSPKLAPFLAKAMAAFVVKQ